VQFAAASPLRQYDLRREYPGLGLANALGTKASAISVHLPFAARAIVFI
jgi:hypothetical protein